MVETILLAVAIFWNPSNFVPYAWHTLNLAKKLDLKIQNLKTNIVKERKKQIWTNKILAGLDKLFANNPNWWPSTTVILSQVKK